MPQNTVGLIGGLVTVPVHRLARVVLFSCNEADVGYFREGIGEIV
jgi:hypothetical protein